MNKPQEARAHYEQAARYSTAYYGQLARAKLGLSELALACSPVSEADKRAALANNEIVRAVEILYATDRRDLVVQIAADLAERASDPAILAALAEPMAQHEDARCTLLIARGVLSRGTAFDHYAFPTFGLPRYTAIAPDVEPAVVYSIARQESALNAKAVSSAHALGLMQVTPEAGSTGSKASRFPRPAMRIIESIQVYRARFGGGKRLLIEADLRRGVASAN
jgi:soluble lytic murein transglycosylase